MKPTIVEKGGRFLVPEALVPELVRMIVDQSVFLHVRPHRFQHSPAPVNRAHTVTLGGVIHISTAPTAATGVPSRWEDPLSPEGWR